MNRVDDQARIQRVEPVISNATLLARRVALDSSKSAAILSTCSGRRGYRRSARASNAVQAGPFWRACRSGSAAVMPAPPGRWSKSRTIAQCFLRLANLAPTLLERVAVMKRGYGARPDSRGDAPTATSNAAAIAQPGRAFQLERARAIAQAELDLARVRRAKVAFYRSAEAVRRVLPELR